MTTAPQVVPASPTSGAGAGKIVLAVVGALVALVGIGLLAGGGAIVWANATQRDEQGFFTSASSRFTSDGFALTGEDVELIRGVSDWLSSPGDLATFRAQGRSATGEPIFVGIAPAADIDEYLRGVAHDEVVDLHMDGWKGPLTTGTVDRPGTAPASLPGAETFWSATASGSGDVTLTWPVREGTWSILVMNADGSRGVTADLSLGAKVNFLGWIALGLLAAGSLLVLGGGVMVLFGVRSSGGGSGGAGAAAVPPARMPGQLQIGASDDTAYPVTADGALDPGVSRWLWLVKWFLAIPHYIVLAFLWLAVLLATVVAFFAILVTGRYPRGIFDFNLGVLRWSWRVAFYSCSVLGTDRYPPFTLGDVDYPARLEIPYPEQLSRGLVLVKSWLLAIPHYLVLAALMGSWGFGFTDPWAAWPGLNGILVLVAAVALLFTGRYPPGIFDLVVGINRWALRVAAYVLLMRDEYPPFRLDR